MRVAVFVFGAEGTTIKDIEKYLPKDTTDIETVASMEETLLSVRNYADEHRISYGVTYPNYDSYGYDAPRRSIADAIIFSDCVIAFWDGESCDIIFVKQFCEYVCVPLKVYMI